MIDGQGALIHLDGWTWQEMAVMPSALSMHLNFPVLGAVAPGPRAPRPTVFAEQKRAYEAKLRDLHEFFEQARRYQKAKAAPTADFQPDLKFEAMLPVLDGKLPLMVTAVRQRAIRDAVAFADKERIHIVLAVEVCEPGDLLKELEGEKYPGDSGSDAVSSAGGGLRLRFAVHFTQRVVQGRRQVCVRDVFNGTYAQFALPGGECRGVRFALHRGAEGA